MGRQEVKEATEHTRSATLKQKLSDNEGIPFYITWMIGDKPMPWKLYPTETDQQMLDKCNLRQILKHEVIIDIDVPKTMHRRNPNEQLEESKRQAKTLIIPRLKADNIEYTIYYTGNKGVHIQIEYPELRQYTDAERLYLKREIIKKYAEGCDYDLKTCSAKCLIQMEDTPHRKTLKYKQVMKL